MNTKLVMTGAAVVLGSTGIVLTFAPEVLINALGVSTTTPAVLLAQLLGALYFGFAMLNWLAKGSLIGGIYNRPVAIANLTHFVIAGLAIIKVLTKESALPTVIWGAAIIYVVFGVLFGIILFTHPVRESK